MRCAYPSRDSMLHDWTITIIVPQFYDQARVAEDVVANGLPHYEQRV